MVDSKRQRETIKQNAAILLNETDEQTRNQAAADLIEAIRPCIKYALAAVRYQPPITHDELETESQADVFLNLEKIVEARNPAAYIISMCRLNAYRYVQKNRPLSQADPEVLEDIQTKEAESTDWIDDIENPALAAFLKTLKESDQQLLREIFVEGKSQTDIAKEKGCNRANVSRKIGKLLDAARRAMEQ